MRLVVKSGLEGMLKQFDKHLSNFSAARPIH